MFATFFLREIKSGFKAPMVYVFFFLLTLMVLAATISDSVVIGGTVGNIYRNAPFIVNRYTAILTLMGLLMATAFFNNAALRDYNYQFYEILFSTPLSKSGYFYGRFFGALVLSVVPFLGIYLAFFLGRIIGPATGWMPIERLGPQPYSTFISSFLLFVVPNMFVAGTIIFAMSTKFKSTAFAFIGTLVIIMGYIVSLSFLRDFDNEWMAGFFDIFGMGAYSIDSKYYTPIEKNTLGPNLSGVLFYNRIFWIAIGIIISFLSYWVFNFKPEDKKFKAKKETLIAPLAIGAKVNATISELNNWNHFVSFFKMNFWSIFRSTTFRIIFLFSLILLVTNIWGAYDYFGLKSYPVTYKLIGTITDNSIIFLLVTMVFFSGELVWRDRECNIHEVIDSSPFNNLIALMAKAASLITLMSILYFGQILFAIVYQLANGYTSIEPSIYLFDFLLNHLPLYISMTCILIFVQVLVNHKYLGFLISVLILFFWDLLLSTFGIESKMVDLGISPSNIYSDMNGFGPGIDGTLWFNLYWILFGFLALLKAGLFWTRGQSQPFLKRMKAALTNRLSGKFATLFAFSSILWFAVAGFVYYNTQILNPYLTTNENEVIQAKYEQQFKKYENILSPVITDATYHIDIYPKERKVHALTNLIVVNKTDQVIDSLHFTRDKTWGQEVKIPDSKEVLVKDLSGLIYQIFQLDTPMQPGDSIHFDVESKFEPKGFKNGKYELQVVKNGTFFNNESIVPYMGYTDQAEMTDVNKRKKYNLLEKTMFPDLEENCGHNCTKNYISNGKADFLNIETFISTDSDQIAIAPGSLLSEQSENGRNHYHYKVDHPALNFIAFISAEYQVKRRKWNDLDIEVYYHEKHGINVDIMMDAVERSLAYYIKEFGPYYNKQARIIEFPRYKNFAQAFPGTMPYSESLGFITNLEDKKTTNNIIDAVIAHEIAHQWWAHQEISAKMLGATMLTESFAEYSSLMVMKHALKDDLKMKEFIKYDMHRYLRGRSREVAQEQPLYKVDNQDHIHYGKGAVIMYGLQDYIGEDKVNRALRNFLEAYKYKGPPYPTTLNFLAYLEPEVPDSLKYLINDWFKEIVLYDHRLIDAQAEELDNGQYKIVLEIESHKIVADSLGNEQHLDIDDWVDIGLYADEEEEELIYKERIKFNQKTMKIDLITDKKPAKAAIDPLRLLVERLVSDNVKKVNY